VSKPELDKMTGFSEGKLFSEGKYELLSVFPCKLLYKTIDFFSFLFFFFKNIDLSA